jgi:hypothetical protein
MKIAAKSIINRPGKRNNWETNVLQRAKPKSERERREGEITASRNSTSRVVCENPGGLGRAAVVVASGPNDRKEPKHRLDPIPRPLIATPGKGHPWMSRVHHFEAWQSASLATGQAPWPSFCSFSQNPGQACMKGATPHLGTAVIILFGRDKDTPLSWTIRDFRPIGPLFAARSLAAWRQCTLPLTLTLSSPACVFKVQARQG